MLTREKKNWIDDLSQDGWAIKQIAFLVSLRARTVSNVLRKWTRDAPRYDS